MNQFTVILAYVLVLLMSVSQAEAALTFLHHFNDTSSFDINGANGDFAAGDTTATLGGSPGFGAGFFAGSLPGNTAFRNTGSDDITFDNAGGNIQFASPTSGGITAGFWFRFENPTPGAGNHGARLVQLGAPALDDDYLRMGYSFGPGGLWRSIHRDGASTNDTTIQTTLGNETSDWTYVATTVDLTNSLMSVYRYDENGASLGALSSAINVDGWNLANAGEILIGRGLYGADAILIDELSIDNEVLSESEITARVASMVAGNQLTKPLISGEPGYGLQWIRDHEFTIMSAGGNSITWDLDKYLGAGLNTVYRDRQGSFVDWAVDANAAGVPWQGFATNSSEFDTMNTTPGATGWMIGDEPARIEMAGIAAALAHARQQSPNTLVYTNAKAWGSEAALWGSVSHPSYSYSQYLDDIINIIKPDVLMYDQYPFIPNNEELFNLNAGYFGEMMMVRNKALVAGLPYWAWIQTYNETRTDPYHSKRRPSESDMRMQIFSYLAAGFTGFNTWTYDGHPGRPYYGLIDFDGFLSSQYHFAADAFAEAENIGRVTRFLTSQDVRFVPGQSTNGVDHPTLEGLVDWSAGAGGDNHIVNVDIDSSDPTNLGARKDGLIGFFTDDDNQQYFMLTNLYHGEDTSSADTALDYIIQFDSSITQLLHLNRESGDQELLLLNNNRLVLTLPGGTGELFKYDTGNFPGIAIPNADFDGDGDVDSKDFLTWQRGFGILGIGTLSEGDANGDGDVNQLDLEIWQNQYGTAQLTSNLAVVPEPVTIVNMAIGLLTTFGAMGRRFASRNRLNLSRRTIPTDIPTERRDT